MSPNTLSSRLHWEAAAGPGSHHRSRRGHRRGLNHELADELGFISLEFALTLTGGRSTIALLRGSVAATAAVALLVRVGVGAVPVLGRAAVAAATAVTTTTTISAAAAATTEAAAAATGTVVGSAVNADSASIEPGSVNQQVLRTNCRLRIRGETYSTLFMASMAFWASSSWE